MMTKDEKREAALSIVGYRLYEEVNLGEVDNALTGRYKSPTGPDVREVKKLAEQIINRLSFLAEGVALMEEN